MRKIAFVALALVLALSAQARQKDVRVEIARYKDDRKAAVSFTYDDGVIDHYTLVAPHLEAAGIRGTFWIVGTYPDNKEARMTWDKIKEMSDHGHEISNHSWTHSRMNTWTADEIRQDLAKTDSAIALHTGKKPRTAALPFNDFRGEILPVSQEGRVAVRTYQTGQGQGRAFGKGGRYSTLASMKKWLQKTIDDGEWGVTMTHGIHEGWDTWEDPQVYWDFIDYCSTRAGEVWFDTFVNVACYVAERDACTVETRVHGRRIKIIPHCTADRELCDMPLTLKVSVDGSTRLVEFDPFAGPFTIRID